MLSDEETQAIEYLKRHIIPYYGRKGTIEFMLNDTLLNLIEKQQKEIESLKEKLKTFKIEDENIYLQFGEITEKKRWKDKIKAKIEECEKEKNIIQSEMDFEAFYRIKDLKNIEIEVLQSLLEKE